MVNKYNVTIKLYGLDTASLEDILRALCRGKEPERIVFNEDDGDSIEIETVREG